METKRLFDEDVMQKECEAEVVRTEPYHGGFAVVLDQTVFFPEGGGQLSDTGTLTDDIGNVDRPSPASE